MRRPTYVDDTIAEMPAMWYGGHADERGLVLAGGGELERCRITYDVRWRWRSTAAFGSPVVPDVNSRMATLSVSKSGTKLAWPRPTRAARSR